MLAFSAVLALPIIATSYYTTYYTHYTTHRHIYGSVMKSKLYTLYMYVTSAVALLSHILSDTTITYSTDSVSIIVKFTRQTWRKIQIRYALIQNKLDI